MSDRYMYLEQQMWFIWKFCAKINRHPLLCHRIAALKSWECGGSGACPQTWHSREHRWQWTDSGETHTTAGTGWSYGSWSPLRVRGGGEEEREGEREVYQIGAPHYLKTIRHSMVVFLHCGFRIQRPCESSSQKHVRNTDQKAYSSSSTHTYTSNIT